MKKIIMFLFVSMMLSTPGYSQFGRLSPADSLRRDSINKVTQQDHKQMMAQLKIDSIRRGANGNDPNAPNAANYDESKANPYPNLPDPLTLKNGQKVTDAKTWWDQRRPEIVEDFDREVYGRTPKNLPKVNWEVIETKPDTVGGIMCTTKTVIGHVDNSSYTAISVDIQLQYTYRNDAKDKAPVILNFGFVTMPGTQPFRFGGNAQQPQGPSAQEQIIGRGWVYASIAPNSIQADKWSRVNTRYNWFSK
jgi:hypothetical protein